VRTAERRPVIDICSIDFRQSQDSIGRRVDVRQVYSNARAIPRLSHDQAAIAETALVGSREPLHNAVIGPCLASI
jgi:hypothetical protein